MGWNLASGGGDRDRRASDPHVRGFRRRSQPARYYLKNAWDTNAKWTLRTTTQSWATPGAKGVGTDITSSTPAFSDSSWTAAGVQTRQYSLDPAVVQGWIDMPSTNEGIILTNAVADKQLRVYTAENTTAANHPQLTITYTVGGGGTDAGAGCTSVTTGTWHDDSFAAQTAFTAEFDATPSAVNVDEVMGFSSGAPGQQFTNLEAIARFFTNGVIEARDGATYTADNPVTYSAGTSYHFKFDIDVASRTYSVYVTPSGGSQITLASNYAFRSDAPAVSSLDDLASEAGTGTLQICNLSITPNDDGGGGSGSGDPPPSGDHPRIWLDPATLTSLTASAQSGTDQRWATLRAKCHSYIGGDVWSPPDGISDPHRPYCGGCSARSTDPDYASCSAAANNDSGCNSPDICCGYQGSWFYDALLNNALCYQIGTAIGDTEASQWGAKGVDVLMKMASFQNYGGDHGFGIKFFGTSMAIGFDWLYPLLTPNQRSTVVARLNGWITWYDSNGTARNVPLSNYFAGYFAAKAYVALATEGDNPSAPAMWSDFMNRLYRGTTALAADGDGKLHPSVADYFKRYVNGSGYPQGWEYGNLSLRNMVEPMIAAKTAKGIDLIKDATQPFSYALETPTHLIHATWPSLAYIDDRDDIHSGNDCPGLSVPSSEVVTSLSSLLERENDPLAKKFHAWARSVRSTVAAPAPWLDFLFWDDSAQEESYTSLPMSYLSSGASTVQGKNYAMMRSGWSATDTWGSLRALAYTNSAENAHQFMDAGSLAITRGNKPFLVNPSFLTRCYGTASIRFSSFLENHTINNPKDRQFFNVLLTTSTAGQSWIEAEVDRPTPPQTGITQFFDGAGYVYTQAEHLSDMYPSSANISAWSRSVIYLRPNIFVVYDRTTTTATGDSTRMAWHFPPAPTLMSPPSSGAVRYDVTDSMPTDGGFKGAMTTLLPQNARVASVNAAPTDDDGNPANKLWRLEVRAPSGQAAPSRWLTVLDASSTTGSVAIAKLPQSLVNATGAFLTTSGQNYVALFGSGAVNQTLTLPVTYTQPKVATKLVVADLLPNHTYSVTATLNGTSYDIKVDTGTGFTTSSSGTLYASISATGQVSTP